MLWIGNAIPPQSRWWPVFQRYLGLLSGRVSSLGGDPSKIPPTGTGTWPSGPGGGHERREDTGKIVAISYDRFGDFDGFILETYRGHKLTFHSRERRVEAIVRRAWHRRIEVTVTSDSHSHSVAGLTLLGIPPEPC